MNILILEESHFLSEKRAKIEGQRLNHITGVLKAKVGDHLQVGILNGALGSAQIVELQTGHCILEIGKLNQEPPPSLPITLILGLPRPRMLQRTLQTIATMGVRKLCLIQTGKVEKSFWQTPLLKAENVKEQLLLGLEQGRATQLPEIEYFQRFIPFAEDILPSLATTQHKLIAHPGSYPMAENLDNQSCVLAVGPEGGFQNKEVDYFRDSGFSCVQLGPRILRVETAIPVLLGKLY